WIFVGASGTLFEAPEPLAAFSRTIPTPEPFASVAGDGTTLLAVTLDGRLMRWEEAAGWRPGAVVASAPARLHQIAVAEGGRVLGAAFPEALFASEDSGLTWKPLDVAPSIGLDRIGVTDSGALLAQGLVESLAWSARTHPSLTRTDERLPDLPE